MKQKRSSLDGFTPRRQLGQTSGSDTLSSTPRSLGSARQYDTELASAPKTMTESYGLRRPRYVNRPDIEASLRGIESIGDMPSEHDQKAFNGRKKAKGRTGLAGKLNKAKVRRGVKIAIISVIIITVLIGGYLGYRAFLSSNKIFKGNILGLAQTAPLKVDENGRSNILVLGTSEDDPGHGGAYLTDSMMIVSLDQEKKTAKLFSIPRDLYVEYGMACNSGYEGKINEYFNCVDDNYDDPAAEQTRLADTQKFVGDIFGVDVQYGVHVNNTVIKDAVDSVGGIEVDIQGSGDAPGILDRNFDWRCNYKCNLVKYDNGVHKLDGEHALYLAMARGDIAPTYGLGNSNFDREKNQQKIIIALKEKAVSAGTLANFSKVTGLIDALGNNLRTNFETKEVRTLASLGQEIPSSSITTISLFDEENRVVTTGNYAGQSVVIPVLGAFQYDDVQKYIRDELSANPVTREKAQIDVYNGTEQTGLAQDQAEVLESAGFTVGEVDTAPDGDYGSVDIYAVGDAITTAPETKVALESRFKTKIKSSSPPVTATGDTKFIIIFGKVPPAKSN